MKDKPEANRISRRRFIQSGAAASLGLLLVGCGDDEVAGETATAVVAAQLAATETATNPAPTVPPTATAAAPTVDSEPTSTANPPAEIPTDVPPTLSPTPACGDDDDEPTPAQTEGPYYTPNTPERSSFWEADTVGTRLVVTGRILTTGCLPVAAALLDFWHADAGGAYDNSGYKFRGHQFSDANGNYRLETVLPGLYPGRTRHIHVKVQPANGPVLTTQLYFPNEPDNARDGIFDAELLVEMSEAADGLQASFDFVLA
ncbi:MAG: hypothetical protein KDE59_11520 [Anaerolineales bacterium]|nr:hypothetical protein [Anaerolineales bacterium]